MSYDQENFPGHAEDRARVLGFVSSLTVSRGTYSHVLETEEYAPLEPDSVERKFYASGIGFLRSVVTRGPAEFLDLVTVSRTERGPRKPNASAITRRTLKPFVDRLDLRLLIARR